MGDHFSFNSTMAFGRSRKGIVGPQLAYLFQQSRHSTAQNELGGFMVGALIIGLIVGAIAKFLMPGKDPGGIIVTMLLGVAGAAVAHFIGKSAGWYGENEPAGFIAAIVGAMVLLGIYRMATHRTALT